MARPEMYLMTQGRGEDKLLLSAARCRAYAALDRMGRPAVCIPPELKPCFGTARAAALK